MWRARLRDDDGRVWKASADTVGGLDARWLPAKEGTGDVAVLASLRPVTVDVRVEAPDGAAATGAVVRTLVGAGVLVRRWREDGLTATLHRPAGAPCATVLATASPAATLAAPLLASRGVLVLLLARGAAAAAVERLALVPGAGEVQHLGALAVPPGVPARATADAAAWDALLARLGAAPRVTA